MGLGDMASFIYVGSTRLGVWSGQNATCCNKCLGFSQCEIGCTKFSLDLMNRPTLWEDSQICTFSLLLAVQDFSFSWAMISPSSDVLSSIPAICSILVVVSTFFFSYFLLCSFLLMIGVTPVIISKVLVGSSLDC